jgi:hypothetical protein
MNTILNSKEPKTRKEQQTMPVDLYSELFSRHVVSYKGASSQDPLTSQSLTSLTSSKVNLNGTHPINRPLIKLRKSLELRFGCILCYPDFNKPFHLYTDASDHQLGPVIMQDKKPIAFYSRKLNTAQK